MRALCAAIITAGALIGLGLTALGLGVRYQPVPYDPARAVFVHLRHLDTPLMLILVVLLATAVIGLGATFLGLAYHHERRHHERHRGPAGEAVGARVGP